MLQQTQVSRVLVKYAEWTGVFPSFETLAAASVAEVLAAWQGLGYNRRALWLLRAAQLVVSEFKGVLPRDPAVLVTLPGIGPNTAGSIAAFAYEEPTVFIETNIRRVFIHEFFGDEVAGDARGGLPQAPSAANAGGIPEAAGPAELVSDKQLLPLIEATIDHEHPREWYYALMDYGANLAKQVPNPNRQSKHYTRQSQFEGSRRQIRGEVLRQLLAGPRPEFEIDDERLSGVLAELVKEGFITEQAAVYRLAV